MSDDATMNVNQIGHAQFGLPTLPNVAKVASWKRIDPTEEAVMEALVSTGPLSIVMDATLLPFYRSGNIILE